MGMAVLTKIYSVITLPLFAIYVFLQCKPATPKEAAKTLVYLGVPLVLFAFLVAWYNYARFGGILKTGYHLVDFSKIDGFFSFTPFYLLTGLYGLLLSTGRGLILFLPTAVLALVALKRFSRTHRNEALLFTALIGLHLLFFSGYINWDGGSSWGPRFLLVTVPFLVLPLGALMECPQPRASSVKILGILGFLVNVPVVLVNYHLFVRFVVENQIGTQTHPISLRSSPLVSPIIGAYYQLSSAVHKLLFGSSLTYPVPSATGGHASLASYDWIDTWWINAVGTGFLGTAAVTGLLLGVALVAGMQIVSAKKLCQWAKSAAL